MATYEFPERRGRETRLLVLIVGVSLAALLLLARLRFPSADQAGTAPAPGPLAGLAGRATFDDLAETMNSLLSRVSARLVLVELDTAAGAEGRHGQGRLSIALRVGTDRALLYVPSQWHPVRFLESGGPVEVMASDSKRQLALLRTPPADEARAEPPVDVFPGLTYVGMLGATHDGPTILPLFLGRVSLTGDERWPGPLYDVTGAPGLSPGTFVFSVGGGLIGLTLRKEDEDLLVPAGVLDIALNQLSEPGTRER